MYFLFFLYFPPSLSFFHFQILYVILIGWLQTVFFFFWNLNNEWKILSNQQYYDNIKIEWNEYINTRVHRIKCDHHEFSNDIKNALYAINVCDIHSRSRSCNHRWLRVLTGTVVIILTNEKKLALALPK